MVSSLVFIAVWIAGLALGGPSVASSDSGARIQLAFQANTAGAVQGILVHGIAGLALAALGVSLARILRPAAGVAALGLSAAVLSWAQLGCELALFLGSAVGPVTARDWWIALSMLDGAKMIVIGVLILLVLVRARRLKQRGRTLSTVSILAIAALAVSGFGYLMLSGPLMTAAYASLPLLLLWAGTVPVALRRYRRAATAGHDFAGTSVR
ncbi:hypothetical protein LVY72_08715 [Arthrobacter sp. I2-34]|uniref:DUF4386 domain-containing protein n=1 Tax=Arthrobacter hankyongi TaxID=2904801 RepID=A0ABS9L5R1_9MICC|nr:hypothetical protein [Arthrobacter hankyongi]MCG2621998.1 hypothetical protein [Arthrobacter hankyongi]